MELYLPNKILEHLEGKEYNIDSIGMSDSSVLIFEDSVLKIRSDSEDVKNEHRMMEWLKNKVPVPEIIEECSENGRNYLLMTKIPGEMACDEEFLKNPSVLVSVLAEAIKLLWSIDISDCPIKNDLSTVLSAAEYRVEHGLVDVSDAEADTFGKDGFESPEKLLEWLFDNRPKEDFVLSHGDFCLPNIFIERSRLSGFVDIGRMGVADRWQDIALCSRSLEHNFSGRFGGKKYPGYSRDMLFDTLGIEPDEDKLRYYILLDELF